MKPTAPAFLFLLFTITPTAEAAAPRQYEPICSEDSISRSSELYDARRKIFWASKGDQTDRKEGGKEGRKEGRKEWKDCGSHIIKLNGNSEFHSLGNLFGIP